ncbi:hypothetical protein [Candidatus Bodocaedibacter vickermanii]|uniref:Uncharacterized protein n=1 Tax=Candidatus Bodocaedibacter vickermanii TaxID=2741701 RepID=A0A7L9RSA4_9PROT|nr:hypothetical protein CPBP_00026 [Candidatus Paracaedibacteraceae bacterium 'Lake Konstanz']
MKRLLLSTALILGTLSGVKGVLPDVQHAVSPTVGQDQAAATVVAHVDPQPALETEEPTAETKFELILKQLMAEVASLRRSVETTSEQLASKVIALENRQGTMNATLLRLAPPTPAVVADIDDLFADAFTSTDFLIKDRALKTISEQLNTMGLYPSSTAEARQSIATSINEFINSITNYKSSTYGLHNFMP